MAVRGAASCAEAGIFTCIAVVVRRGHVGEVPDVITLARSLSAQRVIHFNFIPTGRGAAISEEDPTPEEREALLRLLYREGLRGGLEVLSTAPQYARVALQMSGGRRVAPTHFYAASPGWGLGLLAEVFPDASREAMEEALRV